MANVSQVTALWQGFTGAPGYSKFNFDELADTSKLNAAGAAVRKFFADQSASFANAWTIGVQPIVQTFNAENGDLVYESAMTTPPAVLSGTGGVGTFAGGSGYVCHWITASVRAGRKVRGRTFIVPAMVSVYSSDGTVGSATITSAQSAGNALIADPNTTLMVWSRTWDDGTPPQQVGGLLSPVTGIVVPDRAAQLRTRRT